MYLLNLQKEENPSIVFLFSKLQTSLSGHFKLQEGETTVVYYNDIDLISCHLSSAFIESFCDPSMSSTNVSIPELPGPNDRLADSLREKVCRSMPCTFNTKGIASTEHEGEIVVPL